MVIDKRRSLEDFDYWEYYESIDGSIKLWNFVFNPVYSMGRGFIKEIDGALFISRKEIIF